MKKKRGEKLQIVFSNRWLYTFVLMGLLIVVAVGVNALTAGTKPNPGHLLNEVAIPDSNCATSNFLQWNGNTWGCTQMTTNYGTGASWTPKDSSRSWRGVAMSADAVYQTAVATSGGSDYIYVSSDSGNTWTAKGVSKPWKKVAISSNGQYQTVVGYNTQIYVSSDSGNTWIAKGLSKAWNSVSMSNDGRYQTAVGSNQQIYVSTDYGNTWTAKDSSRYWTDVAVSSTGQYQSATATSTGGYVYISSDYGNTWTAKAKIETYVPVAYKEMEVTMEELPYTNEQNNDLSKIYDTSSWTAIDISGNGQYQTAYRSNGGEIYISTDYGNTWIKKFSNPSHTGVSSLALSSTGQYQIIGISSDYIYVSSNYGQNWTSEENARSWIGVAISADGQSKTATTDGDYIYVYGAAGTSNTSVFGHNIKEFASPTSGCSPKQFLQWDGSNWKCGNIDGTNYYTNNWTAKGSSKNWEGIAMSSDGQYQTAAVYGGQIYISTDSGETWTAKESNREWTRVAMSNNGQYQTALVRNGAVYTSSNYGVTWTARGVSATYAVAMSGDGQYQAIAGSQVYISSDYGNTWTAKGSSITYWFGGIAISDDGRYISAAHGYQGKIYVSSDYGATWTTKGTDQYWNGMTMSANGKYQTAVTGGNQLYISSDYGNTWTAKVGNHYWWGVAMSNNGQYQIAGIYGAGIETGRIWLSSDYGNTWTVDGLGKSWYDVAISDNGEQKSAVAIQDYIYVYDAKLPSSHPSLRHNLTMLAPPAGCTANQFVDWTGSNWKCVSV